MTSIKGEDIKGIQKEMKNLEDHKRKNAYELEDLSQIIKEARKFLGNDLLKDFTL
jgi:hypothetical protein